MAKNAKGDGLKTGLRTGLRFWLFTSNLLCGQQPNGKRQLTDAEIAEEWQKEFPGRKGVFQPVSTARSYFNQACTNRPGLHGMGYLPEGGRIDGEPSKKLAKPVQRFGEPIPAGEVGGASRETRPGVGSANFLACGGKGKGEHGKYVKGGMAATSLKNWGKATGTGTGKSKKGKKAAKKSPAKKA